MPKVEVSEIEALRHQQKVLDDHINDLYARVNDARLRKSKLKKKVNQLPCDADRSCEELVEHLSEVHRIYPDRGFFTHMSRLETFHEEAMSRTKG